jgi:hypothetical protein
MYQHNKLRPDQAPKNRRGLPGQPHKNQRTKDDLVHKLPETHHVSPEIEPEKLVKHCPQLTSIETLDDKPEELVPQNQQVQPKDNMMLTLAVVINQSDEGYFLDILEAKTIYHDQI